MDLPIKSTSKQSFLLVYWILVFIGYSDRVRNGTVQGNYVFDGIEFQYDGTNPNYWQDLNDDLNDNIPRSENTESYSVMRPIKFNAAFTSLFW